MLKEAVKEVLEEKEKAESSQGYPSAGAPKSSAKAKGKKVKTEFDETRTMSPVWDSDPRTSKTQWPCFNNHVLTTSNNKWGRWTECRVCALRTSYTPAVGAPATTCKIDHSTNAIQALERLRQMGWTKETMEENTVKNMLKLVASEQVVMKPKSSKGAQPSKGKKNKAEEKEDAQEISDGSFEGLDPDKTTSQKKGRWRVEDHEMEESHVCEMDKSQKMALSESVRTNWAVFDSSQALRDLRGTESEHLWEICCSPHSALSNEMRRQKFKGTRFNYESGFDLGNKQKVQAVIDSIPQQKPTRIWGSPRCTAVSSI